MRDVLNSTKIWMDTLNLESQKGKLPKSEFHKLVNIDEVMLIVSDEVKKEIRIDNIPFPADPLKVFTHNYSVDYRNKILKRYARHLE